LNRQIHVELEQRSQFVSFCVTPRHKTIVGYPNRLDYIKYIDYKQIYTLS